MGDIGSPPTLEVVICTYNNAPMLADALAALARQRPPDGSRWGCLVVDNNCTDATTSVVEKHIADGTIPGLRVVREPRQGLTPSRLCGVRSSVAPWIAFVDDDCILENDWIGYRPCRFAESHPDVGAFGGTVTLDFCADTPAYARAYGYSFAEQNHGDVRSVPPFSSGRTRREPVCLIVVRLDG